MSSNMLENQVAIITGASRGLGARIAALFWEAGASLVLTARDSAALSRLKTALGKRSSQDLITISADLAQEGAPELILDAARGAFDRLDVLVNNAGVQTPIGPFWTNPWAAWRQAFQVNLFAPVRLCQLCVPWMEQHRYGRIVNVSGGGATRARPNFSAYAAAKAALVRFSETLAEEVRGLGITVNCVAPGPLPTKLLEEIVAAGPQTAGRTEYEQACRGLQAPRDVLGRAAALCLALASPQSAAITGKLISAVWDPWEKLETYARDLMRTDVYTLRRIVPQDRGLDWGEAART